MNHYFNIRRAIIDDLNELQELFVETITTICVADYNQQQIEAWASGVEDVQRWKEILLQQIVIVVQYQHKIVGFATLHNENFIDLLYVHKNYQRQGIAGKLLAAIEAEARRQKQNVLIAEVSKTAKPFFKKHNFKNAGEQIVSRKGVPLVNYKMIKSMNYM